MAERRGIIYGNLAHMVAAGVPVVRAANTAAGASSGRFARALKTAADELSRGTSLADAMRRDRQFRDLDRVIVEASDEAGHLAEGLRMLSQWYLLLNRMRWTIIGGLVLPAAVLGIGAFAAPVPQLVQDNWDFRMYIIRVLTILAFFYVPLVAVVILIKISRNGGPVRAVLDRVVMVVPVLGSAICDLALSRYCLVFHMMAKAGVSAVTAAEKSAALTGNAVVAGRVAGGADSVRRGNPVSLGFSRALPVEFREMWMTGEETGDIDTMAAKLAERYSDSAQMKFKLFSSGLAKVVYALVCLGLIYLIFRNAAMVYLRMA